MQMVIAVVVVIASSVGLFASATAPTANSTMQCNTTYNASISTISDLDLASCRGAYNELYAGTANANQRMMVCNTSETCNNYLQNITRDCGTTLMVSKDISYIQIYMCTCSYALHYNYVNVAIRKYADNIIIMHIAHTYTHYI